MRVGVGAAVVLLILAAVVAVLVSATAQQGSSVPLSTLAAASGSPTAPAGAPTPVARTVRPAASCSCTWPVRSEGRAGVAAAGARVVDAVAAAGGLTDDADAGGVNLARPVADGEQLVVPRVGEAPVVGAPAGGGAVGRAPAARGAGPPVNLNTATQPELETLPRIGPALAQRILDWRAANGRFVQAADLLKVTGIGQKLFDGLKDRVVV